MGIKRETIDISIRNRCRELRVILWELCSNPTNYAFENSFILILLFEKMIFERKCLVLNH